MANVKISDLPAAASVGDTDSLVLNQGGTTKIATKSVLLTGYATLSNAQTFAAAQTFRGASAVRSEAAATQDAVVLAGRAGGTSSYAATLTPTTLSANRTLTLPNADTTLVGTDTTQTLTNKTISADDNTLSGLAASSFVLSNSSGNIDGAAAQKAIPSGVVVGTTDSQTLTNKTLTSPTITGATLNDGYTEEVHTLATSGTIALNPANGTIQTCAAAGTVTFTDSLSAGQSILLMLTGGSTYTINWPTVTWVTGIGNSAPARTASDVYAFWKVSTTLYATYVGSYA